MRNNVSYLGQMKVETALVGFTQTPSLENTLEEILSPEARYFLTSLHLRFGTQRKRLLERRQKASVKFMNGELPFFPSETEGVRSGSWKVAPVPRDLRKRHVEITGPCEPKMMINALNSGADVFMADLEDSLSPTWENILEGHRALKQYAFGALKYASADGKIYEPRAKTATLIVRPRGWHLLEENFLVNGEAISASLFDFGLYFFHCAKAMLRKGSGPYFYLPKMESYLEARLWNEVFVFAQQWAGVPEGTIRATVLIETFPAAFEMDEILFELRDHAAGLNAGRWDYLFSMMKKLPLRAFPDRAHLTMDLDFLRAYCELLVQTCHRRGAHAIGGMSAFIPSRKNPEINELALRRVISDKQREISIGFDGSWVAHPDLVEVVKYKFAEGLSQANDQKYMVPNMTIRAEDLLPKEITGEITELGVRTNISVALIYMHYWLNGQGAVAIHNLMEDAATAEISRAQLWQWVKLKVQVKEGYALNEEKFQSLLSEELSKLETADLINLERKIELLELMRLLVLREEFPEFLTIPAYQILRSREARKERNQRTEERQVL